MTASQIEARARAIYGVVDWSKAKGILHVAAIGSPSNRVIALGPDAPSSATDRFVLGLARARAEAIVTTGSILRAEPELVHRYSDDSEENAAIGQWRRREIGRAEPPAIVVLSASGNFPVDHPALEAAHSGFVWSNAEGRARLREKLLALPIEIEEEGGEGGSSRDGAPGLARALERVRQRLGAMTLLIEAGPTTASLLYPEVSRVASPDPPRGDELLLSSFEGVLRPEAVGPPFVAEPKIRAHFGEPVSRVRVEEASGAWRFERMRRIEPAGYRPEVDLKSS